MYHQEPGLYTDMINPFETNGLNWPFLHSCGFTWASFQCYNPQLYPGTIPTALSAVRAHGFSSVGVWGVIYDESDFYNGGKAIGTSAKAMGADHLIVDCEQVYKDSKADKKGAKIIKGIRDGGWNKGVSLSTLGSPTNPYIFDFNMDTLSFLDSGDDASIQPQDYYNDYEEYSPFNSDVYWKRVGVPANRINHTLGLYSGKRGKMSGAAYIPLLQAAKVGKNFSVYMAQDATKEDYLAFADYIKKFDNAGPTPVTPPQQSASAKVRSDMTFIAQKWINEQMKLPTPNRQLFSRIRLAKRILQTDDKKWETIAAPIKQILDDAGVTL